MCARRPTKRCHRSEPGPAEPSHRHHRTQPTSMQCTEMHAVAALTQMSARMRHQSSLTVQCRQESDIENLVNEHLQQRDLQQGEGPSELCSRGQCSLTLSLGLWGAPATPPEPNLTPCCSSSTPTSCKSPASQKLELSLSIQWSNFSPKVMALHRHVPASIKSRLKLNSYCPDSTSTAWDGSGRSDAAPPGCAGPTPSSGTKSTATAAAWALWCAHPAKRGQSCFVRICPRVNWGQQLG